jgi:methylglutamate dehydrogenase subunit D
MVEQLSPLVPVYRIGRHGNPDGETGVVLTETRPGSIVQLGCWPGNETAALAVISTVTGLAISDMMTLSERSFGFEGVRDVEVEG